MIMHATFFLKNGRVIDPSQDLDKVTDLLIKDGRIVRIGDDLREYLYPQDKVFDVDGCIVTPGLIDCHVHCYEHCTPLGINPDTHCLARGVTSVVDAGSAGTNTVT